MLWFCWRTTWGPKSRSGREALRSRQTAVGRSKTIATGRQWVLLGERDQRPAVLGPDAGGIDDGHLPRGEALAGDEVQHLERIARGRLVVPVVGHEAAEVRGDDRGVEEVPGGKRRLAGP
jgi:hypothetical protein